MNTVYELFDTPLLIWKKRIEVTQSFDGPAGPVGFKAPVKGPFMGGGGEGSRLSSEFADNRERSYL